MNFRVNFRALNCKVLSLLAVVLTIAAAIVAAQETDGVFNWQGNGLKLETAPLPRDQVVAFMLARGFDGETARFIAQEGCIFRSAIGRDDETAIEAPVSVDLDKWRIRRSGQQTGLRTRQKWAQILNDRQIDAGAGIALEWALFPTRQSFAPDDYNWGLLSFALPPGTRFDLVYSWTSGDTGYEQKFTDMECAK